MKSVSSRILRFLELRLSHGTGALHAAPWDLRAALVLAAANNFYQRPPRDNAKRAVRIRHLKFFMHRNTEYAALLFALAESDYIDATYEHIATGQPRSIPKEDGEAYRTEAHMVMKTSPTMRGTTQVYPVVLEESPGLSPSVILGRLTGPIRTAAKRTGTNNRTGETVSWGPNVELAGLLSASLLQEIARGELASFDLVREYLNPQGLDEHDELVQRRVTLHIDVAGHPAEDRVPNLIQEARRFARREAFDKVVIRYTEAETKKSKSADIYMPEEEADDELPLEKAVARTVKIVLAEAINDDHIEVVDSLSLAMIRKLHDEPQGL